MQKKKTRNRSAKHAKNIEIQKWKCTECGECFGNRPQLKQHRKEFHYEMTLFGAHNKGKTKENCDSLRKQGETLKKRYANGEIKPTFLGKHHSEETKRKISEARKAWILANPDKSPYIVSHYSKGESYAERYFREWMENESITYLSQQQLGTYTLDFLIGNIDLEIDGEQHYKDERISASDIRRNKYVEEQGLKVIRVRWSHYQKLPQEEKYDFLERLKVALTTDNQLNDGFTIDKGKLKKVYGKCKECGKDILTRCNKTFCSTSCVNKHKMVKNVEGESLYDYYKKFVQDLKECSFVKLRLAKKYGVSETAIRKRIKRGLEIGYLIETERIPNVARGQKIEIVEKPNRTEL